MKYSLRYGRFRALLRKIREEADLTQTELAARLGKHQKTISKYELGERSMDFLETVDFCDACNVSISRFSKRLESEEALKKASKRKPRLAFVKK